MKNNTLFLVVFCIILLIGGIVYARNAGVKMRNTPYGSQNLNVSETPQNVQTVTVIADKGTFSPNTFEVALGETLHIEVTAKDKDYAFSVKDYPRLDAKIAKGETKTVEVGLLGVGDYSFTCGSTCAGTIHILQSSDDDD